MSTSMDTRPPTFYAAAYVVLRKGEKILLIHRTHTGFMDDHWGLPSGHIEGAESVNEAARREAQEEVGVVLREDEMKLAHVMHRPSSSGRIYFDFFFTAHSWSGEIQNGEPDKHAKVEWFPLDALPKNIIPYLGRTLERIQNGVLFSEDIHE